jgi:hypothetical protein
MLYYILHHPTNLGVSVPGSVPGNGERKRVPGSRERERERVPRSRERGTRKLMRVPGSRERGTRAGSPFSGTRNAESHAGSPFPETRNAYGFAALMNPKSYTHFRVWKLKTTCAFSFLVIQYVFLFSKTGVCF